MKPTTEQAIRNVIASLEMEGFEITDDTRDFLRRVADGEATPEELVKEVVNAYKKRKANN